MSFWNMIPDESAPGSGGLPDGMLDIEGPIDSEAWLPDMTGSKAFKRALAGVGNVTVRINSPGGDVMAGAEIYSALLEHRLNGLGSVKVIITALAASAASVIAMAGDEILISPVAYMMIHNPWTIAGGNAKDLRHEARVLDEIAEGLITAYERKTGKTREQLRRMLENETWMSAQTCVDEGFADGIWGGEIRAAAMAGAGMMTGATPESIRELCARWMAAQSSGKDGAHGADQRAADPEEEPVEPENPNEPEEDPEEGSEKSGAHGADQRAADPEKDPEEPENPNEPEEPEQAEDPEDPDEPEQAEDPEEPEKPEQAEDPEEPEKPEPEDRQAEDPEEPDEPEDPEDPEDPEEPGAEDLIRAEIARRAGILAGLDW